MTRPKAKRCIHFSPQACCFRPEGSSEGCEEVVLLAEELEALRLYDVEGLDQTAAAERMGVSQPTFARIVGSAHAKVAGALVLGRVIRIARDDEVDGAVNE